MLKIQSFTFNPLSENTYVVSDETKQCAIIDCGAYNSEEQDILYNYVKDEQLNPVALLSTHGHFDHNLGTAFAAEQYNLTLQLHSRDQALYEQMDEQLRQLGSTSWITLKKVTPAYFDDDFKVSIGNHLFEIIPTPGHTKGSVCFYCHEEKALFSGDTLFQGTIGRTDLPFGSMFQMTNSLRRLCQLPDEVQVYPGHGPQTSIALELSSNPFLDR